MTDFTLIAHRGFSSKAPENTLAAFDKAIGAGFTNIELDVQLSSDGMLVVIHDEGLDRTTDGQGLVAKTSLEELRKLDAGTWFGKNFVNERIPTLREVLERYQNKAHLHIELKSTEPELANKVLREIKDTGWFYGENYKTFIVPGITITSFNFGQLERSLNLMPDIPHHWLLDSINTKNVSEALRIGLTGMCPIANKVSSEDVDLIHTNNLTARGWGVNSEFDLKKLVQDGAEGATVNWPDRAADFLQDLK